MWVTLSFLPIEVVPFVMLGSSTGRDVDDAVAPKDGRLADAHLLPVHELLGAREHQVHVRVEAGKDAPVLDAPAEGDYDPLAHGCAYHCQGLVHAHRVLG